MNTRTLTIVAAAIAVTAVSFTAPASATSLGTAGQTITQSLDRPIIEVGKKWHGKHGKKWHGKKWHGKKWHGKHFHHGLYPAYPYGHGYSGCYQKVKAWVNGYYVWTTINLC